MPETRPIDLARLKSACDEAATAAADLSDPAAAIEAALEVLHERLDGSAVAAFVLEHERLWSVGVRGYAMIPDGLPLGEGVIGRSVRQRCSQIVLDVADDPDFIKVHRAVVSECAIPLVTDGGVVDVINVETTARLPSGGDAVVARLARSLARPMEELLALRTVSRSSLARLFVHMSSLRDSHAIAEVAVRSLGRVLPIETSQLLLVDESGQLADCEHWRASDSGPELLSLPALKELRRRIDQSAVFELLDTSMLRVPELAGSHVRSVVLIPLRANGEEIGMLVGTSRFAKEFDREQAETAALLAAHTAASVDAALALGRERQSAHTDPLTGLLNRRGLEQRLHRELDEAQDDRRPLSLIVLDCDDFKDVNDRAGHAFGDALLREIGFVLRQVCPDGGSAARLGGDEFVVMLPATDADAAFEVAARLRVQLDAASAYLIADFPVTKEVLDSGTPRSLSFLDEDLDPAEAFMLRELGMNCALLLAIVVDGCSWGLVEVYDMRLRRFSRDDVSVSAFLVAQAARRIEALGGGGDHKKRRLPLFRLPSG